MSYTRVRMPLVALLTATYPFRLTIQIIAVAVALLQIFTSGALARSQPLQVETRSIIPCGTGECDGDSQVCCGDNQCYIKEWGCTSTKRGAPPQLAIPRATIPCGSGTCDADTQVCCGDDQCYIAEWGCVSSKRGAGLVPPQPVVQRSIIPCGSGTCNGDTQVCCGDNKCYIKEYGCGKRSVLVGSEPVAM